MSCEASRIISSDLPGMKFIAGDFNQLEGILPETKEWESKGWVDIQTLAERRWKSHLVLRVSTKPVKTSFS